MKKYDIFTFFNETFLPFFNRERKDKHRKKLELIYKYNQREKAINDFYKNPELISNTLVQTTRDYRRILLQKIMDYYHSHIPGFTIPKSLSVLSQVLH